MRVLLKVWGSNPDFSDGCDYATVEMSKETLIAPPDFRVPESQVAVVECAQMIVRHGVIAFTALLRHTDIYLTTAEIPKGMIESALVSAA